MKTMRSVTLALAAAALVGIASAQGVRPEVGRPLQQAGELLKAGKAREALARVREAETASGITANERLTIDRMKAAAAQRAGDHATAVQALEAIHPRTSGAEAGQIAEQLASAYAQLRNNGKATEWMNRAIAAGHNTPTIRQLQQYLLSVSGDYAAIARDAGASVAAAEQAGRRPAEADLLRLADAQQRLGQQPAHLQTLERLVLNYPGKKDYWAAYLGRLPRKSGFSSRYELDVQRLKLASGTMDSTAEFMEMAQVLVQVGLPAEALRVTEQGFKTGALGTGPEAARHQRLRDLIVKRDAETRAGLPAATEEAAAQGDGDALVRLGQVHASIGQYDEGIKLIERGLAKGKLRHAEEAKLRLGLVRLQAGQRPAALQTLRAVRGNDGTADIARLWTVLNPNGA
jgi:tetratricopeptide (TPR) repeat protein